MSITSFASNTASSLLRASHDIAMASIVQPSSLANQSFVVGLGFFLVSAKLVAQILVGSLHNFLSDFVNSFSTLVEGSVGV